MSERKSCIRCERPIDVFARICPYCNWDQAVLPPPRPAVEPVNPGAAYVAERDEHNRRMVILAGGFAALLVVAFAVGSLIHGFDVDSTVKTPDKENRPAPPIGATVVPQPKGAKVDLVPVTQPASTAEAPITSAPVATASTGTMAERSDATALPSVQYAQAAARAQAERQAALTDPRSIVASPYAEPQRSRRLAVAAPPPPTEPNQPMASSAPPDESAPPPRVAPTHVVRTLPVPEAQPLPEIHVRRNATVRLNLTIGPDGRVHDVEVLESIPGETPRLIDAVQNWRFRPATENGLPVASHFSVDISFRAND